MQLSDYLSQYLSYRSPVLKPSTRSCYQLSLRHICASAIGSADLSELNGLTINLALSDLILSGRLRSAQLAYVFLRQALHHAYRLSMTASDLSQYLDKPRHKSRDTVPMPPDVANRLLSLSCPWSCAYALCLLSGLRRGEVCALTWSCVSLTDRTITVANTISRIDGHTVCSSPKSAASRRTLPISDALYAVLLDQRRKQLSMRLQRGISSLPTHVATPMGDPVSDPRCLYKALQRDLSSLHCPSYSVHSMRHAYATAAVSAGVHMRILQYLLGHDSIDITARIYAHVSPSAAAKAANLISYHPPSSPDFSRLGT